jgi:hypothetical protein
MSKRKSIQNETENMPLSSAISSVEKRSRKRVQVKLADDADKVLAKCRALKEKLRNENKFASVGSTDDGNKKNVDVPKDIVEVDDLSTTEVLEGIESVALQITRQVLQKKGK